MELYAIITVGVLTATGVYMMLQRSLLRVVLGSALVSEAVHLLLLTSGRLKRGGAPLVATVGEQLPVTDPLPQAMILTAIVIGFGTTALVLVLAYRTYQAQGSDDLDLLRGIDNE